MSNPDYFTINPDYFTINEELSELISEVYKKLDVNSELDNLLLKLIEKQKEFNREIVWRLMDLDGLRNDVRDLESRL